MKPLSKLILILASAAFSASSHEPLPDRAVVERMNADLLLPNGSILNVDVSFDCGSDYHNTALMVMSDSGARLLAAAFTHLYGEKYGQQVIDAWNTKKHADDPRKPTYLFAIAPREKEYSWKNKTTQKVHNKLTRDTLQSYQSQRQLVNDTNDLEEALDIPVLAAGCGTKIHNPQAAQ
jgi:hypothetical protein